MIAFFYERVRKLKAENKACWPLAYKIGKLLVNLFYPAGEIFRRRKGTDDTGRIIVSLTSFPGRIKTVWLSTSSLLNQTKKPCRVILWLAEEQFPERKLPKSLLRLQRRGLEIRFCEDLKPHKKYFYTMLEYPEYYVVTADDDILYPENHIERLWAEHERHPHTVICHWSHQIALSEQGEFAPYNSWEDEAAGEPGYGTLAVGCNGILYPPGSLPAEAFDREKIRENALDTDDLWLKCMEIQNGWKTVNGNETVLIYFSCLYAGKGGLWKSNTGQERNNDRVWERLMALYPEVKDRLLKEIQREKEAEWEPGKKKF